MVLLEPMPRLLKNLHGNQMPKKGLVIAYARHCNKNVTTSAMSSMINCVLYWCTVQWQEANKWQDTPKILKFCMGVDKMLIHAILISQPVAIWHSSICRRLFCLHIKAVAPCTMQGASAFSCVFEGLIGALIGGRKGCLAWQRLWSASGLKHKTTGE